MTAPARSEVRGARRGPALLLPGRLLLVTVLLAGAALALVARAAQLQIGQSDFLRAQGDARNLRVEPLAATRGLILDRNGQALAVSTPVVSIWANPPQLLAAREKWKALARKAGVDYEDMKDRILRAQSREFLYVRRHLAPDQAQAILALNVPGVYGMTEYRRFYPAGEVAAHVVGFTNIDDAGQEGMELAWESRLGAHVGKRKVIKDLNGRVVDDVEIVEDARPGGDLALSIDLRIQYLAYRELAAAVRQQRASGGSVVVLDVETGEVLAMANQPSYNPNNRADTRTSWLRNRAVTDMFEPGSTMKTFTVAAALESGKFRPGSLIETSPGKLRVGDKVISDHHDYGLIDITTVLTKSSNIGSTKLALAMEPQQLVSMFHRVGFGVATHTGFPGESTGSLVERKKYRPIELATLSYGYGVSVTALQLAQSYAVIASGGMFRPVTLLRRADGETVPGERVMSAQLARTVTGMLSTVTTDSGTAARARINGYSVAGKTGTVHKLTGSGYAENEYLSLFAGMAPASAPRVVTVVVIDNPGGTDYFGGLVAAPVFSAITAGALRTLNVSPDAVTAVAAAPAAGGVL
ncbi:MAG: peptidoglycan D,D-transpeptidase FtsI family protein [Pseudomonadota bacterium]